MRPVTLPQTNSRKLPEGRCCKWNPVSPWGSGSFRVSLGQGTSVGASPETEILEEVSPFFQLLFVFKLKRMGNQTLEQ